MKPMNFFAAAMSLLSAASVSCGKDDKTPDNLENTEWVGTNVSMLNVVYPTILLTFKENNEWDAVVISGKYDYQKPDITLTSELFGEVPITGTVDGDGMVLMVLGNTYLFTRTK